MKKYDCNCPVCTEFQIELGSFLKSWQNVPVKIFYRIQMTVQNAISSSIGDAGNVIFTE